MLKLQEILAFFFLSDESWMFEKTLTDPLIKMRLRRKGNQ